MPDLCDLTATELRTMIGRKDISPVELVESCIERIESIDGRLNAIVTKSYDRARDEARDAEKAVLDGEELGLLHGLPLGRTGYTAARKQGFEHIHQLRTIAGFALNG